MLCHQQSLAVLLKQTFKLLSFNTFKFYLAEDERFQGTDWKTSPGDLNHFTKLQVKVFPELCTIGTNRGKIKNTGVHLSRN